MTQPAKAESFAVLTKDQAARVDRINAYHDAGAKAFGDHMGYVFLTGAEMNALKEDVGHGNFEKVREVHFPRINERSAQRYMLFAGGLFKSDTVSVLPSFKSGKLLTNGDLPESERDKILKAVHEAADGKTLTQLYRDIGIIRDKEPQKHTPAKPLTAEEKVEAETEQLKAPLLAMMEHAAIIRDRGDAENAKLAPKDWAALLDAMIPICKLARTLRKTRKQKKGAPK